MSGPWAVASVQRSRQSVAARQAPVAFALVLVHPIAVLAFTLWAVDGLLHCNESDRVTCHRGFAVHLLFPAVVGVGVALAVGIAGLAVRPSNRWRAWLLLLAPTTLTWLTVWWVLAITAEPGPAPWYDPPGI